jgi:pimeloyl-ACP methyl ester carboxylesterase
MKIIYMLSIFAVLLIGCSPYGNLTKMEFKDLHYAFPVKKAVLDENTTIAYVDEGTGNKTILFVHGLGSYIPAWRKNIPELSKHYRCIAVDLPGYGKSSKEIHSGSMDYYADVLVKFMDKLGLKKVVLAGHSMGGQIGIVMALKYPERIEDLILVSPAGFERFTEGQKQWFRDVMTEDLVEKTSIHAIRDNVAANFYNMPKDAEFMVTDRIALRGAKYFKNYCYTVVQSVNGMVDQPVADFLGNIKAPTLILFAENDNLIPNPYLNGGFTRDVAEYGHRLIKNSKLVMVPSCGHFVQFEKPEVFNKEVENFLK